MDYKNASECWKEIQSTLNRELLSFIESFARENPEPAQVVFGTSGWRGEIGSDFTFKNVAVVTEAIIKVLKTDSDELKRALGIRDFEDVKNRGIIVGHDNRFLGPEFSMEVIGRLNREGIRVFFAGETTTPEISASIEMLNAACSINITPSHNPSNYSGLKFNPSDGGPAGPEITNAIQDEANRLMGEKAIPEGVSEPEYERIDTTELYIEYLKSRGTIDLDRVRSFVREADCLVVVDHVHGATRGRPPRLLDAEGTNLVGSKLFFLRTEDDYLFGGVAPEPSAQNMKQVEELLKRAKATYRIGVIMDPDGDRIRFADHRMQIPMNYFGAMALHFLYHYKGIRGVAVKSVGTS
ncbi:MAG: phosphomannomutase, partial [Nitrospirae bacterium]